MCFGVAVSATASQAQSTFQVDPAKAKIAFEIDAAGWPKTTGVFREFSGRVTVNLQNPPRSRAEFLVRAASVDVGSSSANNFVRSASMLDTGKHAQISFRSTSVEKTGERSVALTGEMTFYGQTRPVRFIVDVDQRRAGGKVFGFSARGIIRRSEFGLISGQPLIADEVKLTVSVEGPAE